jgi:hypothetical protein
MISLSQLSTVRYYQRKNRRALRDPASALYRTHSFTIADTDIDTAAVFGDDTSREQPVTFAFSLSRSGVGAGLVLDFGSDTRGLAVWVDDGDVNVAAGAGSGSADDGVTLNAADAMLLTVAKATLTLSGNAGNGQTVTIDGKAYTFQTVLTNVNGNVLIGASASDSIDNLIAAINLSAGSGTLYAAATTLHPTVTASAGAGDTMIATAKTSGTGGNSISVAKTLASGVWSSSLLRGGLDPLRFVISVEPGTGKVELYRNGMMIQSAIAVNGNFGGAWADSAHGAIGDVQGASNDRVPGGSQITLANALIVGGVSVFLHQRAGA